MTKTQLKEAFKDFGPISNSEVFYDEKGRSKGYGTVMFDNKKDADEAIKVMD